MMSLKKKQLPRYCEEVLAPTNETHGTVVHPAWCDRCKCLCAGGPRYKCVSASCDDFDLCCECFISSPVHASEAHCILRLDIPLHKNKLGHYKFDYTVDQVSGFPCSQCSGPIGPGQPCYCCVICPHEFVLCAGCCDSTIGAEHEHPWDHVMMFCPYGKPSAPWPRVETFYSGVSACAPERGIPPTDAQRRLTGLEFDASFITIRPFNWADMPEILAIESSAFEDPYGPELITELLSNSNTWANVADFNGIAVAYLMCERKKGGAEIYAVCLAVHSLYRKRGLGPVLLKGAIEDARAAGAQCMTLHVNALNSVAYSLYSSLGFVNLKKCPGYYAETRKKCKDAWKMILNF